MGVPRWTSVCAWLVLTAVLAGGAGCRNDKSDDDPVTKTGPLDVTHNKLPTDPGSPGLEPPNNTGNPATPGTSTGGSTAPVGMMTGTDMGASGNGSANPSAGASGGNTSAPGATAGSGSPTMNPTVDAGAPADGGMADGGADDPCAEPECGIDQPCSGTERQCIFLTACAHAVCIDGLRACEAVCGSTDSCAIFESFPAQIGCN